MKLVAFKFHLILVSSLKNMILTFILFRWGQNALLILLYYQSNFILSQNYFNLHENEFDFIDEINFEPVGKKEGIF